MTPLTTLADATDIHTARIVMEALKKGGWIVVDKGAIGRAQDEAVRQHEEDNGRCNGEWWRLPTTPATTSNNTLRAA